MPSAITSSAAALAPPGRLAYEYDALVLDAGSRQALATLRGLSKIGLQVAMGECFAECDPALPVLAFRSRYCAHKLVVPSFAADPEGFAAGVADFVRAHPTRLVLPGSDGSVAALLPSRDLLASLGCHLALPPDSVLDVTNKKERTLEIAQGLGILAPRGKQIGSVDELLAALDAGEFEFPMVLKPTSSWAETSGGRLQTVEVVNRAEAAATAQRFLSAGTGVLAQQYLSGRREGVMMFVVDGEVHANVAYVQLRTSPALGGASVLRQTIPMPADIYAASVRLVRAIGVQGMCEVEFRRDSGDRPLLMEINARPLGCMETAMRAGVDFPLLLWQWATGRPVDHVDGYKSGVRMRWLRGDLRWLVGNRQRIGRPDSMPSGRALRTFTAEFLRAPHYDGLELRDLGPMRAEWRTILATARKHTATRSDRAQLR